MIRRWGTSVPLPIMNYTHKVIRKNAEADSTMLGVRLGRLCIQCNVTVNEVATSLGVSRMVVYRWFAGKNDVHKHLRDRVEGYYKVLSAVKSAPIQLCLDLNT